MNNKNDFLIDDDFLTIEEQNQIKNFMVSKSYPWFFIPSTASHNLENYASFATNETKETFMFESILFDGTNQLSPYAELFIENIFKKFVQKNNITVNNILRAKTNLVTRQTKTSSQSVHVDLDSPHNVFLYYVNDSDGDTVFYNEKFNGKKQNLSIRKSVSPKMGRGVFFDGHIYHAPSTPTQNDYRCVINIDFN